VCVSERYFYSCVKGEGHPVTHCDLLSGQYTYNSTHAQSRAYIVVGDQLRTPATLLTAKAPGTHGRGIRLQKSKFGWKYNIKVYLTTVVCRLDYSE